MNVPNLGSIKFNVIVSYFLDRSIDTVIFSHYQVIHSIHEHLDKNTPDSYMMLQMIYSLIIVKEEG